MGTSVVDNKFLTFSLGQKEYGVDITKVREIIGYTDVTAVPRSADYVHGVIDLRGRIVPIIALRGALGMPAVEIDHETCVVILEFRQGTDAEMQIGFIVDAMRDVRQIDKGQIEPPPSVGGSMETDVIRGFAKVSTGIITLLEVDALLSQMAANRLSDAMRQAVVSGDLVGD